MATPAASGVVEVDGGPWGTEPGHQTSWPSAMQEQLLRATLIEDERALEAWRRVRPAMDIARLDGATQALLPLLRRNLLALGVEDELLELFKGVHRYSWARNQMLLAPMMPVVQALERAGMGTLLLKGAAFVADRRLDAGMRPMNDVDVLVPAQRLAQAVELLLEAGLMPVGGVAPSYVANYAPRFVPSHGFRDALDRQLDLHWHVLHASRQPDADEDFWAASTPVELLGVRTRALCPADELLLVILHGLRWNAIPTYRWVLDAALLSGGTIGAVDYDRLVVQARKRRVGLALCAGLLYLRRVVEAPVPQDCIDALGRRRAAPLQRLELRAQVTAPTRRSRLQWQVLYHQQHARCEIPLAARSSLGAHLGVARRRLGVERIGDVRHLLRGARPGPGRPDSEMAAAIGGAGERPPQPLAIGETLELGADGSTGEPTVYGTWRPEPEGRWIAGREARLQLPLADAPSGTLVLELTADGYLPDRRPRQRVEVVVNGNRVARLQIAVGAALEDEPIVLPRAAIVGVASLDLVVRAPDAISQAALGLADDDRAIGVFLRRLRLRAPHRCADGSSLTLGEGSGDRDALLNGWGAPEPEGRWTLGSRAELIVRRSGSCQGPLVLEFDAIPFLGRGRRFEVDVTVNGRPVATVPFGGGPLAPVLTRVTLAAGTAEPDGVLLLAFSIRNPCSPRAAGLGPDDRELGLFVRRVALLADGEGS